MLNQAFPLRIRGVAALVAVSALMAAPLFAQVPGRVDFQGLLLDSVGEKVNGTVDLAFTLYDLPSGGSVLWSETHVDAQVTDGVYGVTLGATTPLTQAVLGGGNVFLQIVVDGEVLTPRRQLLAVPYAIRAADADTLGGTSGSFFTEIVESFAFDGGAPANDHPSEGTADTDGDGLANFLDPDNDADGVSDVVELGQGSDINLVTPTITGFSPNDAILGIPTSITVLGSNFESGLQVVFGVDTPTPQNLTATSFDVALGAQPTINVNVSVTLPNGQSASAVYTSRGRRVFMTAATTGNIGGISGADARCATRAGQLGLTGTFLAWIGDSTTSPATRFLQDGAAYQRLDGTFVADNWADLTDGSLDAPIQVPGAGAWTGVMSDGTASIDHCLDWTSSSAGVNGLEGVSAQTNGQWTQTFSQPCALPFALYCFEQ